MCDVGGYVESGYFVIVVVCSVLVGGAHSISAVRYVLVLVMVWLMMAGSLVVLVCVLMVLDVCMRCVDVGMCVDVGVGVGGMCDDVVVDGVVCVLVWCVRCGLALGVLVFTVTMYVVQLVFVVVMCVWALLVILIGMMLYCVYVFVCVVLW